VATALAWFLGIATLLGGVAAAHYFFDKWRGRSGVTPVLRQQYQERLGEFLAEAQQLRSRLNDGAVSVTDHNAWVDRVSDFLRNNLGKAYEVRFSDFSGMTFYGDSSERSRMSRSLEGRCRRLHEFMAELPK
jgi:hypothetical protein